MQVLNCICRHPSCRRLIARCKLIMDGFGFIHGMYFWWFFTSFMFSELNITNKLMLMHVLKEHMVYTCLVLHVWPFNLVFPALPLDLEPPRPRPQTSTRTAQRLIAQGMGLKLSTSFGSRELRKQEEARKDRIVRRQKLKDDAWGEDWSSVFRLR